MMRLLLVDDDKTMLEFMEELLDWNSIGYELIGSAQSGEEALEITRTTLPDVVITDIRMPGMNGPSLCEQLSLLYEDVSVIVLSAYGDLETTRLVMKYHVADYLLKPMTPNRTQQLVTILTDLAKGKEQRVFLRAIQTDKTCQSAIQTALQNKDLSYLEQLFVQLDQCLSCTYANLREACSSLITLFFSATGQGLPDRYLDRLYACLTKQAMLECIESLYGTLKYTENGKPDVQKELYTAMCEYIANHFTDKQLNIAQITDHFHLSASYLSRVFQQYAGKSIYAYIIQKRLEYAASLLTGSNLTIAQCAEASGYESPNYFAHSFSTTYGMSPREYRMVNTK